MIESYSTDKTWDKWDNKSILFCSLIFFRYKYENIVYIFVSDDIIHRHNHPLKVTLHTTCFSNNSSAWLNKFFGPRIFGLECYILFGTCWDSLRESTTKTFTHTRAHPLSKYVDVYTRKMYTCYNQISSPFLWLEFSCAMLYIKKWLCVLKL